MTYKINSILEVCHSFSYMGFHSDEDGTEVGVGRVVFGGDRRRGYTRRSLPDGR